MITRCTTRYLIYKPKIGDRVILAYRGYKKRINLLNDDGEVVGRIHTKKRRISLLNSKYLNQQNFLTF